MTTSYKLSLKLKELGVPQEGGEYYWVELYGGQFVRVRKDQIQGAALKNVLCRALTLGELVRFFPEMLDDIRYHDGVYYINKYKMFFNSEYTTPEEAAGELLAELKQKEVSNV